MNNKNVAVFASGQGSNFLALLNYKKKLFNIKLLFCDQKHANVIKIAQKNNIPVEHMAYDKNNLQKFDNFVLKILDKYKINFIVLAGYMKIISKKILKKWNNKIINIHPSLLPNYRGKNAIKNAFENQEKKIGITIHYVDENIDTGKIIFQKSFCRKKWDNFKKIEKKVHNLEHKYYVKIINSFFKIKRKQNAKKK